jgi:hypothetical protein
MPIRPEQCTGELATKRFCEWLDLQLDAWMIDLKARRNGVVIMIRGFQEFAPSSILLETVGEIYRHHGWRVTVEESAMFFDIDQSQLPPQSL